MSERSRGSDGSSGPGTQDSPSAGDDIYAAAAASAAGRSARRGGVNRSAHEGASAATTADDTKVAARALPDDGPSASSGKSPAGNGTGSGNHGSGDNGSGDKVSAGKGSPSNGSQPQSGNKPAEAPAESTSKLGTVASSVLNRVRPGSKGEGAETTAKPATKTAEPQASNTAQPQATNTAQPQATNAGKQQATNTAKPASAPSPSSAGEPTAALPREQLLPAAAPVAVKASEPAKADKPKAGTAKGTRKARLRLSRLDPWSVMKTAFLFSIAAGIVLVVAVYAVWLVIGSSGLFGSIDSIVGSVLQSPGDSTPFKVEDYINTQKVMGVTAFLACIDVVIFTALATLASFLYNLAATMLGGLEVTLAED